MIELKNGDCLIYLKEIKSNSVDLVISDINYGTLNKQNPNAVISNDTFDNKQLKQYCKEIKRVLKNTGTIVFFGKELLTIDIINIMRPIYKYRYVWKKGNNVTNFLNSAKQPLCNHEDIMIFQKGKKNNVYNPQKHQGTKIYSSIKNIGSEKKSNTYGRYKETLKEDTDLRFPTTILDYELSRNEYIIPTQKPVDLMMFLINTYTNKGGLVLDPCMGVCSSGIACIMTDRSFIGIEKDTERFNISEKRIKDTPIVKTLNF